MAATTYRVTTLADAEAVPEIIVEADLLTRFAPGLADTTKVSNAAAAKQFLKVFLDTEVFQQAAGVKVEKVDAREAFATQLDEFKQLDQDARAAKAKLFDSLLAVLENISDEDLKKGAHLKTSDTATREVGIVEYYIAKAKPDLKKIVEQYGTDLPSGVVKELKALRKQRSAIAESRFNANS